MKLKDQRNKCSSVNKIIDRNYSIDKTCSLFKYKFYWENKKFIMTSDSVSLVVWIGNWTIEHAHSGQNIPSVSYKEIDFHFGWTQKTMAVKIADSDICSLILVCLSLSRSHRFEAIMKTIKRERKYWIELANIQVKYQFAIPLLPSSWFQVNKPWFFRSKQQMKLLRWKLEKFIKRQQTMIKIYQWNINLNMAENVDKRMIRWTEPSFFFSQWKHKILNFRYFF